MAGKGRIQCLQRQDGVTFVENCAKRKRARLPTCQHEVIAIGT
jgi:hypothetical protein